jgi:hypothetical protein
MRRAPACHAYRQAGSSQAKRLAFLFYIYEPLEIFNLKKANIESTYYQNFVFHFKFYFLRR